MEKETSLDLFARADAMYRQGRYSESLAALRKLAVPFPDNTTLLYAMALCLERLDRRDEAVALCDRLVREFHFDKAVILKARLITTPSDPPEEALDDGRAMVWPASMDIEPARRVKPASKTTPQQSSTGWYGMAGVGVVILLVLFLLATVFFAQADTVVPGALPTLFPARLMLCYGIAIFTGAAFIIYCSARAEQKHSNMLALTATLCGAAFLMPLLGWLLAAWIIHTRFEFETRKSVTVTTASIGLWLLYAVTAAYALDLTTFHSIFMELMAGYG